MAREREKRSEAQTETLTDRFRERWNDGNQRKPMESNEQPHFKPQLFSPIHHASRFQERGRDSESLPPFLPRPNLESL
ncbi:hypothetical protein BDM02DRAFT_3117786 [Thelephora ganbajun]|uniref:Uncharacterized protein n=1 Tax=Thelephora ganbajun TaxID=370292 RepID=A0ACB6ZB33_THEGA|nr:hypothetical protein BDM02DRAFT_3117786 [Thelephora ganbajun]